MGVIPVQLLDELNTRSDRQIAEGRIASKAAFLADAIRRFAENVADQDDDIAAMVQRADADIGAGWYVTVSTPRDSRTLHAAAMARLRA